MFGFTPPHLRLPPAWFYSRILVGAGGMLTPRFVQNNGITHVINCAFDQDSPVWFRTRYPHRYVSLNAVDMPTANILDWYAAFEETMHRFLREGNGTVFVHCQAGMNRSASLALAYVCKNFDLDIDSTLYATRSQRPIMYQNTVFMDQVHTFIRNGRLSRSKSEGYLGGSNDGNTGFGPSGHYTESKGIDDDASVVAGRIGGTEATSVGSLRHE
jgi:hypothetical protein